MWSKTLAVLALGRTIAAQSIPTWPSTVDEIEDLMVLQSGYNSRGFANVVTPCDNSPIKGFRVAAGFVRTAFHDVAAYDANARSGGLDGSIGYELGPPYDVHNAGPAFDATITNAHAYYSSKSTISDMIALGVYAAVRSCGGPQIPMRAGRIDASGPGPNSLPDVADSIGTLTGRFAKMGFSPQEMIALVACGHTLGGVHPQLSQNVTGQNDATKAQAQGVLTFDTTDARFDNRVSTEYMDGSTQSPLVIGRTRSGRDLNSDLRVFSSDGNATIGAMTDPGVYAAQCQNVMTKMIERVPGNVRLSDIIVPYNVKPGNLNLEVLDKGAALGFSGEIRVRTNDLNRASISDLSIVYKDRSGASCSGCKISAQYVGDANGFDDQFSFYRFSGKITSISSFNVVITTSGGQQRLYDNGGKGFPYSDAAFVQVSSSSYSGSNLRVVVAVRSDKSGAPAMTVTSKGAHVFNQLPKLTTTSLSVTKICSDSNWAYYAGTGSAPQDAKIDVTYAGQVVDGFRDIEFGSSGQAPVCGSATTTTSSSTTTKSSTTLSSSITTTTKTSSSISSSTSSKATSSASSSTSSKTSSGSSTLSSTSTVTKSTSSGSTLTTSTGSASTSSGSASSTTVSGTLTSTSSGSSSLTTTTTTSGSTTYDGTLTSLTSSSTSSATSDTGSSTTTGTDSSTTAGTDSSTTTSGSDIVGPTSLTSTSSGSSTFTTLTTSSGSEYVPPFWEPITTPAKPSSTEWQGISTTVVTAITTYCPYPTKITTNGATYTVTVPTMLTITDCPCTITVTGQGSGPTGGVETGTVPSGTYVPPSNGKPNKSKGADAVSSIYQNVKPAPSGGTDGGDENIEGVDVNISISVVQPTITKTIAIIATNVATNEWKPWTDTAVVVIPTGAATQWSAVSPSASGSTWGAASGTAWAPLTPSATKTGPVGKFTGAANIVAARGEVVMMGAAAVVGAVALVL